MGGPLSYDGAAGVHLLSWQSESELRGPGSALGKRPLRNTLSPSVNTNIVISAADVRKMSFRGEETHPPPKSLGWLLGRGQRSIFPKLPPWYGGATVLCLPYGALGRGVASVTSCFKDG